MIARIQQQLAFISRSSHSAQSFTCSRLLNPEILEGRSSYACFVEEKAQSGASNSLWRKWDLSHLLGPSLSDLNKLPKRTGV